MHEPWGTWWECEWSGETVLRGAGVEVWAEEVRQRVVVELQQGHENRAESELWTARDQRAWKRMMDYVPAPRLRPPRKRPCALGGGAVPAAASATPAPAPAASIELWTMRGGRTEGAAALWGGGGGVNWRGSGGLAVCWRRDGKGAAAQLTRSAWLVDGVVNIWPSVLWLALLIAGESHVQSRPEAPLIVTCEVHCSHLHALDCNGTHESVFTTRATRIPFLKFLKTWFKSFKESEKNSWM
jgi:hypothetical protein